MEHDAICTVRDLLEKVVTDYAILSARPNMKDVKRALTLLDNHCVIQRIEENTARETVSSRFCPRYCRWYPAKSWTRWCRC